MPSSIETRTAVRRLLQPAAWLLVAMQLCAPVGTFAQAAKKKAAAKMAPKMTMPAGTPAISTYEPKGLERGHAVKVKLTGTNLAELTEVISTQPKLTGTVQPGGKTNEAWIELKAANDLARGAYELSLKNAQGESAKFKLYVDDLRQIISPAEAKNTALPASFWGAIEKPGAAAQFEINAKAGQTLVFDLAAKGIGSKLANAVLTLMDASGRVLASNSGFDGGTDALLAHKFFAAGRYSIRVSDLLAAGSRDHFFRLSIGAFPFVTGVFPTGVPAKSETEVELVGYNLPPGAKARVKAGEAGEAMVPVDAEVFRSRSAFKVLVGAGSEVVEVEPNDSPVLATKLPVPGVASGRILPVARGQASDADWYRFDAKAGETWVIETLAARRSSPVDTKIEVLHLDGKPVPRLLLQAVRDSYINFRPIDSNNPDVRLKNWEEMELNQFVYYQGEVNRIIRMPRGPDAGCLLYANGGKRLGYFDTSAAAHANEETCYIVEPHPLGTKLVPNGLPVFTLNYVNDDDGDRELGADSRLRFTAPKDGSYLVRVTDTAGHSGDRFAYRLTVRRAAPDYKVQLTGAGPTVARGSGQGFSLKLDRTDGFDGEVRVDFANVPNGYLVSTPLVIQAGHFSADGSVFADLKAAAVSAEEWKKVKVTATAIVNGRALEKPVNNLGEVKLGEEPKLFVSLEPTGGPSRTPDEIMTHPDKPLEIIIAPGQMVPVWLRVIRSGNTNLVDLDVDNLPHGIIVDNIGLNGVQVRAGETERDIFLSAAKWVPETDRLCHAVFQSARSGAGSAGRQTSLPVLIKVRKPQTTASAQ